MCPRHVSWIATLHLILAGEAVAQFTRDIQSAVVNATVLVSRGNSSGTGVVVWRKGNTGRVLTSDHILREQGAISLRITTTPEILLGDLVDADKDRDLALIAFTADGVPDPLPLARTPAAEGEPILTSGWADAGSISLLAMTAGETSGYFRRASGLGRPGRSGGAVANQRGDLVGIWYGRTGTEGLYVDLPSVTAILAHNSVRSQPKAPLAGAPRKTTPVRRKPAPLAPIDPRPLFSADTDTILPIDIDPLFPLDIRLPLPIENRPRFPVDPHPVIIIVIQTETWP
jgi:S1-C subfamily serine protease